MSYKCTPCAAVMCVECLANTQAAAAPQPCALVATATQQSQHYQRAVHMCIRGCGVGLEPKHVSQADGSACGLCGEHRRCGSRIWKCGACHAGFCPKCRRAGDRLSDNIDNGGLDTQTRNAIDVFIADAIPVAADGVAFGGQDRLHTEGFVEALLQKLEALPQVAPLASYNYVPKSLSRRVGRLFGAALNWFLDEASGTSLQRGRAASLFLRHLDFLIARDMSTVIKSKEGSLGVTIKRKVQHRINLLEQGDWPAAVAEALAESGRNYQEEGAASDKPT